VPARIQSHQDLTPGHGVALADGHLDDRLGGRGHQLEAISLQGTEPSRILVRDATSQDREGY
jgi:hypothetical protein